MLSLIEAFLFALIHFGGPGSLLSLFYLRWQWRKLSEGQLENELVAMGLGMLDRGTSPTTMMAGIAVAAEVCVRGDARASRAFTQAGYRLLRIGSMDGRYAEGWDEARQLIEESIKGENT